MRLVATSDTHTPVDVKKWIPDGDVFVHAGDLMRTGYLDEWYAMLDWLNELRHPLKIFVPGNHDFHLQVYPGPALQDLRRVGVKVIGFPGNKNFESIKLPNGMTLLGMPYVVGLPRWAFNATNDYVWEYMRSRGRHDIIVSHMPIRGILDGQDESHAGMEAYRAYLKHYKPSHWIHGHAHTGYGQSEYNGTKIYNVALCNEEYEHANPPAVIDL